MPDIYGRDIKYGGGFQPEGTTVSFAGITGGAIVRNINISYTQQLSRIWDLGSGKCYFVAGHTNGAWSVGRVAGPGASIDALASNTVCSPGSITFSGVNGICGPSASGSTGRYTLHNVVTVNVGVTVTSDDMIINETVGGTFLYLTT
jgi:hypothetical protein